MPPRVRQRHLRRRVQSRGECQDQRRRRLWPNQSLDLATQGAWRESRRVSFLGFLLSKVSRMARRGLMEQDLSKLVATKLHPMSPEVISRQATINFGVYVMMSGLI